MKKKLLKAGTSFTVKLGESDTLKIKLGEVLVPPGRSVNLKKDFDPGFTAGYENEKAAMAKVRANVGKMSKLQDKLYAQNRYSLLIIFQALDAAGKDGVIKHVMSGVNPQGCQVTSFKTPSTEELDHDYLWRSVRALPRRGEIGIFNRSHYEEVLITRVHPEILQRQKLPASDMGPEIFEKRYEQINNFEKYLVENGTIVLKFFLNLSKKEQARRFLARVDNPDKNWKFSDADYAERQHWDEYQDAYQACISHTSTSHAPWFVIPADNKWFTRLAVSEVIVRSMKLLPLEYPSVNAEHKKMISRIGKKLQKEI
ncbi:polyphosphate kinase 2 family protein [Ruficoccus amylovorans]|uniref:Polyphosphate kinase 2 family protein n=1 Tax=Ruficoccus amylovorans TaxID=1804625 RepID=A0A842HAS4_9BACT|nr:polyphosphate kinase 2 family protein [Ruficoccus amylovorans]MBC2593583.1 polyphosphate kinase 2 family protein [Ruficoccus amylovorans]